MKMVELLNFYVLWLNIIMINEVWCIIYFDWCGLCCIKIKFMDNKLGFNKMNKILIVFVVLVVVVVIGVYVDGIN